MARVLVQSSDGKVTAAILDMAAEGDDPQFIYRCRNCRAEDTDRGHFKDTIMAAEIHVDRCAEMTR